MIEFADFIERSRSAGSAGLVELSAFKAISNTPERSERGALENAGIRGNTAFRPRHGSKLRGHVASAEIYRCGVDDVAALPLKYNAKPAASDSFAASSVSI